MTRTTKAGSCAGCLLLLCLAASCTNYDAPLGPPRADMLEDRLIGAWTLESPDEAESGGGIYVSRFNAAEYLMTVADSAGSNEHLRTAFARHVRYPPGILRHARDDGPFFFAAHVTLVEGATFLNLRALAREPITAERGLSSAILHGFTVRPWVIARIDFVGDRALVRSLDISLPEGAAHTSQALQRALAGRVHADDSYADEVTVLQRVPLRRGERP